MEEAHLPIHASELRLDVLVHGGEAGVDAGNLHMQLPQLALHGRHPVVEILDSAQHLPDGVLPIQRGRAPGPAVHLKLPYAAYQSSAPHKHAFSDGAISWRGMYQFHGHFCDGVDQVPRLAMRSEDLDLEMSSRTWPIGQVRASACTEAVAEPQHLERRAA